jgi:hypothetical protein
MSRETVFTIADLGFVAPGWNQHALSIPAIKSTLYANAHTPLALCGLLGRVPNSSDALSLRGEYLSKIAGTQQYANPQNRSDSGDAEFKAYKNWESRSIAELNKHCSPDIVFATTSHNSLIAKNPNETFSEERARWDLALAEDLRACLADGDFDPGYVSTVDGFVLDQTPEAPDDDRRKAYIHDKVNDIIEALGGTKL